MRGTEVAGSASGARVTPLAAGRYCGNNPGQPTVAAASPPAIEPPHGASRFTDKVKPALAANAGAGAAAAASDQPAIPPEVIAKQSAYLAEWKRAEAGWQGLSVEEREARRAELKRKTIGE